jgi:hypothetical protein
MHLTLFIQPSINIPGGGREAEKNTQGNANPLFHVHLLCVDIPASLNKPRAERSAGQAPSARTVSA